MTGRSAVSRAHQHLVQEVARPANPIFPFVQTRWKSSSSGSSISCMDVHDGTTRFWGRLEQDYKTGLGHAGQTYAFHHQPLSFPVTDFDGLLLHLLPSEVVPSSRSLRRPSDETAVDHSDGPPTRLTVVLETEESRFAKDGRREVATQWAFSFDTALLWERDLDKERILDPEQICTVRLPFASFLPISRDGAELEPPPKPLRPDNITSLSLVCRSVGPGDQEGTFEFIVAGLDGSPLPAPVPERPRAPRRRSSAAPAGSEGAARRKGWWARIMRLLMILIGKGDKHKKNVGRR